MKELLKKLHFVVAKCLVENPKFTKAITGYVLFNRDLSQESFSFPYVKKHYAGKKTDEECRLIVAVQDGDYILKYKPDTQIVYTTEERLFMVGSVRWVDEVVTYRDVDKDIRDIDFDVFAKGPDQNHTGFQRAVAWCRENGKEVVVIPRTEGISSTFLKHYSKDR